MSSKQIHPGFCLLPAVWVCSLHLFLLGTMLIRKLKTTQCPFVCSFVTVETYQFCFFHLLIVTACAKASDLILQPGTIPAEDRCFRRGRCAAVISVALNLLNLLFCVYECFACMCTRWVQCLQRPKKGSRTTLGEVVSCHVGARDQRRPGPPEEQPGLRLSSQGSSSWFTLSSWKVVMIRLFILCRKDFHL